VTVPGGVCQWSAVSPFSRVKLTFSYIFRRYGFLSLRASHCDSSIRLVADQLRTYQSARLLPIASTIISTLVIHYGFH
jgi:hypothetical protein